MSNSVVVRELSNTQRISLKPTEDSVIIQKEFRKNTEDAWTTSKGIEVPRVLIPHLCSQLNTV